MKASNKRLLLGITFCIGCLARKVKLQKAQPNSMMMKGIEKLIRPPVLLAERRIFRVFYNSLRT
jgi:hypothetical protein